ncbi:TIGR03943 family protein [Amycolatopsis pretoriensis]|uniref:TIGR03943 family protein n=1 Tax=Amycolatopsis pretoriensis TaxID=218821 RepID=A0A1H5R390_9PSEU|nr:TIGR03943 family protein [Amycolatopsis pretoriensis]SEF32815.1 TIGR03943 family protein [Amycolatopsis pretoriensis]
MKRETQNILLVLLGGALVKIAVNGDYLRYVKPAQQPWIIAGGAVMVVLGAVAIVRDLLAARAKPAVRVERGAVAEPTALVEPAAVAERAAVVEPATVAELAAVAEPAAGAKPAAAADRDLDRGGLAPAGHGAGGPASAGHDHAGHSHATRSAWLLLVPVLAVFLVAPPALGADSVIRTEARAPSSAAAANAAAFPPLPAGNVVPLSVNEFVSRAGWDASGTLDGRTISLTGFVVHTGGNTLLARLVISCCAADAFPVTVHLRGGEADHLASDAWIQVTGQVVPGTATKSNSYTPDFTPASITTVAAPKDPYEY